MFLGQSGGLDAEGNELPRLVYVSREKRPGFQHHKKAGAMNALVSSINIIRYQLNVLCKSYSAKLIIKIWVWAYSADMDPLQVRVSAVLTNGPFMLNLDCDHYINNSKALREAMCFLMDPNLGKHVCYVQFPQRFDGIDRNDRYANRNTVFFDVSCVLHHGLMYC